MGKILSNLAKTAALLVGLPAAGLFAYDVIAIKPHLAQIEGILSQANPQDAAPPLLVRNLIDASSESPTPYATSLVTRRFYSDLSQGEWHVRNGLWRILLPMHFSKSEMYGFYATLAPNGTDLGLSNYARREFGKALNSLSTTEAAQTVAITRAPSIFLRDRNKHSQYAAVLLERARLAP